MRAISRPIGAWTARWQGLPHNHEVRWPYVFVSHYEDGLQVFNMMDPTNPYTVGYYDTYDGPNQHGFGGALTPESGTGVTNGAFGVGCPQRGWSHCPERFQDGLLGVQDGRVRRMERSSMGHAERVQRAGLGQRSRGGAGSGELTALV